MIFCRNKVYDLRVKITPLAAESWPGVRSSSLLVETEGVRLVIDPGCALGPWSFQLPPHPVEQRALKTAWQRIVQATEQADAAIITHFHRDHYNPNHPELLKHLKLFVISKQDLNISQRRRAESFLKNLPGFQEADGTTQRINDITLIFSQKLPHGDQEKVPILSVCVQHGDKRLVYTSDVGGFQVPSQLDFVLEHQPDFLFMDGPRKNPKDLERFDRAWPELLNIPNLRTIIFEHHGIRRGKWRDIFSDFLEQARTRGVSVHTAASYLGFPERNLESRRDQLYEILPAAQVGPVSIVP